MSIGTRTAPFTTDSIYKGIAELARIFDVQDRGAALSTELKAREAEAIELRGELRQAEIRAGVELEGLRVDHGRHRPAPALERIRDLTIEVEQVAGDRYHDQ